jgi:hypothetical protein
MAAGEGQGPAPHVVHDGRQTSCVTKEEGVDAKQWFMIRGAEILEDPSRRDDLMSLVRAREAEGGMETPTLSSEEGSADRRVQAR